MKISKKGLYALQALMSLARHYPEGALKIREIAAEEEVPEKFLELILHELKVARFVDSERGVHGGYRLKRAPRRIFLGEVIRTMDGPLAPFGDAQMLRRLVAHDKRHSSLFRVFLDVRNSAARILDHTSLADVCTRRH
ncbi:MAG: Rrf2 family transcriptional regulator [Acidobacteria bacterium]|nr:Rrf2 family transcriptional regulator [Acidobacteriota bacterium]MCL5288220.1 Rrf2 family transcriptional regulator [Acidobacteriota bacterium]